MIKRLCKRLAGARPGSRVGAGMNVVHWWHKDEYFAASLALISFSMVLVGDMFSSDASSWHTQLRAFGGAFAFGAAAVLIASRRRKDRHDRLAAAFRDVATASFNYQAARERGAADDAEAFYLEAQHHVEEVNRLGRRPYRLVMTLDRDDEGRLGGHMECDGVLPPFLPDPSL